MDSYNIDGHKMHYHTKRLSDWDNAWNIDRKLQIPPIYVEISPVGHCNHRCTFCAVDHLGYVNRMIEHSILEGTLEDMAHYGIKSVMFAGEGEPMLHPQISDLTNWCRIHGLDVAFTTNGTAMTEKFLLGCMHSIDWIKISINAGDAKTYAQVHQCPEAHWDKVWKNIQTAQTIRTANPERLGKCRLGVQTVLLPENASTLHELAKKCWEGGVDYLVIKPFSQKSNSLNQQYKGIRYEHNFDKEIESAMQFKTSKFEIIPRVKAMEDWDAEDRGYHKCYSTPFFWSYIMSTGDVYACSAYIGDPLFNLGNIKTERFKEIWEGKRREKLIKEMETFDISNCRKNCRMDKVNRFLWDIKNPKEHKNFI